MLNDTTSALRGRFTQRPEHQPRSQPVSTLDDAVAAFNPTARIKEEDSAPGVPA